MKVNGNIILDKKGSFSNINQHNAEYAVYDFASMVKEADKSKDTLFYDSDEWFQFYAKIYSPKDPYWHGVGDIAYTLLLGVSNPVFKPIQVENVEEFESKPMPKIHGGFLCDGCSQENYVYDKQSINKWHDQWFLDNPDKIDWSKYNNAIWPRYDLTIKILSQELSEIIEAPSNGNDVANLFHEHVMKPLNERDLISKSQIIGGKICEANYYHRVKELEKLETDHGNKDATRIYSIKKDSKYQFLSIDTQHGMLELHNDKGDHQMEIRFDGTKNKDGEVDHSLQCVKEWKQKYDKK